MASSPQVYETTAMIIEDRGHGPQACFMVAASHPPQGSGPDLVNFSWDDLNPKRSGDVIWVSAHLVGTYDPATNTMTLTERPGPPVQRTPPVPRLLTAPCPPPPGDWRIVDPATTTEAALAAAHAYADAQPDLGAHWVDQSINPRPDNDPKKLIFVATFTGDLERHTRALRRLWGGPLCVDVVHNSNAELQAIVPALFTAEAKAAGIHAYAAGADPAQNVVIARVVFADAAMTTWVDRRYGPGKVILQSALRPVPEA